MLMRLVRHPGSAAATAAVTALLVAGLASCGGSTSTTPNSNTGNPPPGPVSPAPTTPLAIVVGNNFFSPASDTVAAGQTVTWTWNACGDSGGYGPSGTCVSHGIIFDDGVKSDIQTEGTFARTFAAKGTYAYHCQVHGTAMSGVVTVQ